MLRETLRIRITKNKSFKLRAFELSEAVHSTMTTLPYNILLQLTEYI